MYTKTLHRQPQRLLSCRYSNLRSATLKRTCCRGAYQSIIISCNTLSSSSRQHARSSSLTWPVVATIEDGYQSCMHPARHIHQIRQLFSNAPTTSSPAAGTMSIPELEYRVAELEQRSHRLTNLDVQHELWPLLANCAVSPSSQYRSSSKLYSLQEQAISRAKLSSRILELCLKEVEDRRVLLWDWLQTTTTNNDHNNNNNEVDNQNFSPTKFWNEAPHPTRQMFNLVLSSWKTVITSYSSSSQQYYSNNSHQQQQTSIQLIEQAANQASTLLHQMEEEYSSDTAFIQEYNTRVDKGRYTTLLVGAAQPDVRNYSEVIGCWGSCIDGGVVGRDGKMKRNRGRRDRDNHVQDGVLQQRLRLEACAMKAMMELLESMEEDLYGTFSNSDDSNTTNTIITMTQKKPPPDRVCYNIILASMARQLNPSLYEMRLVLQRMMERVQFELESERDDNEEEDDDDDDNYSYAMSFFPDIFSYNALIEARANRAAMFTSETSLNQLSQLENIQQQQQQRQKTQSRWRQQLTNKVSKPMKSRFTSSEEEAILAEQMLEEINHISTVSIRPNIWSYNGESCVNIQTDQMCFYSILTVKICH